MKRFSILLSILFLAVVNLHASSFKAGDEVRIEEEHQGDLYIGAGEIGIVGIVRGDLVCSGGEITVEDTVAGDILCAGGEIEINGFTGDDIRVSGGDVTINGDVAGDIICFSGRLKIAEDVHVGGDIVVFGGEVAIYGSVGGNVLAYAGTVKLKGSVGGNAELRCENVRFDAEVSGDMVVQCNKMEIGDNASCLGAMRYWTSDGESDLSDVCDNAIYDEELAYTEKEVDWSVLSALFGFGLFAYLVIFILSGIVLLIFLEYFFSEQFEKAAASVRNNFIMSFGYGMLYLIGMPVLILIAFVTIIGLPLGLLGLSIYGITWLFATSIMALCVSNYFKNKSRQEWSKVQVIGYALVSLIVLKVIFWIIWIGPMLKTIAMAAVFGAFLMNWFNRKKEVKA